MLNLTQGIDTLTQRNCSLKTCKRSDIHLKTLSWYQDKRKAREKSTVKGRASINVKF